ncbi:cytochrome P450 [Mycena leptocephala]|nr:cytochrome P450 [Mycena leptocephala]
MLDLAAVLRKLAAQPMLYAGSVAASLLVYYLSRRVYDRVFRTLPRLPGPENASYLYGNFKELQNEPRLMAKWRAEYGNIFVVHGLFSVPQMYILDAKALSHLLNDIVRFQKSAGLIANSSRVFGPSIMSTELDVHARYRKIINPIFQQAEIRRHHGSLFDKTARLREAWSAYILEHGSSEGGARIDVYPWTRKLTMDIIGDVGFGQEFNSLDADRKPGEIYNAFMTMYANPKYFSNFVFRNMQDHFPILRLIPLAGGKQFAEARDNLMSVCRIIAAEAKGFVKEAMDSAKPETGRPNNLLAALTLANLQSNSLSDEELVSHIPAIILSAYETTSIGMSWQLFALACNAAMQSKLREELFSVGQVEVPTSDALGALPYLDAFLRESLRLYPPAAYSDRVAMEDTVLPLSAPWTDASGREWDALPVRKGDVLRVPIELMNRNKEVWGPDAEEFRPERWLDEGRLPEAVRNMPSVWSNMLTFWAGAHGCPAYRLAIAEMKVFLFTLLRTFTFELGVPQEDIGRVQAIAFTRSFLFSEKDKGSQMPLVVKLLAAHHPIRIKAERATQPESPSANPPHIRTMKFFSAVFALLAIFGAVQASPIEARVPCEVRRVDIGGGILGIAGDSRCA